MNSIRVAIIRAGSMRCGPSIVGSLASYFGERPLELALYDGDAERLELFHRLAHVCFTMTKATHTYASAETPAEALDGADRVILAADENGAAKFLKARDQEMAADLHSAGALVIALPNLLESMPPEAPLLSLLPPSVRMPIASYYRLEGPPELGPEEAKELPHQLLRWIRGDDYMHDFVKLCERSPIKSWLDDVTSATLVNESQP